MALRGFAVRKSALSFWDSALSYFIYLWNLLLYRVPYRLLIAAMAHCDIGVVAAEENLAAFSHDFAAFVNSGVDGGFSAAGADGLDLGD